MKLLTDDILRRLLRNGELRNYFAEDGRAEPDFYPVVKLFTPDAGCTWLLSELDPDEPDIAFGLCDLGMGFPELGSVRISEIEQIAGRLGQASAYLLKSGSRAHIQWRSRANNRVLAAGITGGILLTQSCRINTGDSESLFAAPSGKKHSSICISSCTLLTLPSWGAGR
jgi:hypothetical protein